MDLWPTAHTFLPGHRVRVDIAPRSSPRWDVGRNAFDPAGATTEPPRRSTRSVMALPVRAAWSSRP
ncbi:CocE/NonD family hydrolase C-terminal non-catalytic domain-containing protein [Streptomyces sp. enrichment culture]|uniref:CocE/NonD family hydrolase C-terminal non-catalytic domain-containing protein n=1 Tax=Streptomyces sp. enrichment culture TaxID=1795815 RepID=UPI003F55F6E3